MSDDFSQYYTGFVAEHYDRLVPEDETGSQAFFHRLIAEGEGPALELGCGTGRPMLDFIAAGLDVEGLDASLDMLELCRKKARGRGVEARVHHAWMQSFSLDRRFRTIYIPNASFNLLLDDDDVRASLACMASHLEPAGRIAITLECPRDPGERAKDRWFPMRKANDPDRRATIECHGKMRAYDRDAQRFESVLRYREIVDDAVAHEEQRVFTLHWHTREQFVDLATEAGFGSAQVVGLDGAPAPSDATSFIVLATNG